MSKKYGILFEAALNEDFELDDAEVSADASDIEYALDDLEDLEEDIHYTEEMVNVIGSEHNGEPVCLVEMENLAKYMCSNQIRDFSEALENIAKVNQVPLEEMAVVIESHDTILSALNEAKKAKKLIPDKLGKIKDTASILKVMKTKGIKVLMRKSKGKKRK